MLAEQLAQFRQATAVEFEIFMIRPQIVCRCNAGDCRTHANFGRQLCQLLHRRQARFVSVVAFVPHQRQAKRAQLQFRAIEQPPRMRKSVRFHRLLKVDEIQVDSLESVRQRKLDDFALATRNAQCRRT